MTKSDTRFLTKLDGVGTVNEFLFNGLFTAMKADDQVRSDVVHQDGLITDSKMA